MSRGPQLVLDYSFRMIMTAFCEKGVARGGALD